MIVVLILCLVPMSVSAVSTGAESAILVDQDSGRILYSKNATKQKLIASTTKIMTAILAIESGKLDRKVKVTDKVLKAYGSNIYIEVGEKLSLRDLVYGLMLRSGNDAALMISEVCGKGEEKFVKKMNEKASQLGMTNTVFYNPHGLDEEAGNLSTAVDMSKLMSYAMKNKEFRKITGTKNYQTKSDLKSYVWRNKNKLLHTYENATGGKTGFTEKARRTLVTSASKDGLNLVVVTLNDPSDFTDHKNLYEYGFDNFKRGLVIDKNDVIQDDYYRDDRLYVKQDYYYPLKTNEEDLMHLKLRLEKKRFYKSNEKVGEMEVYFGEDLVHQEPIYVDKKQSQEPKKSVWTKIKDWFHGK